MHQLAAQYGFTAPQVIEQSQRLYGLLNNYHDNEEDRIRHVSVSKGMKNNRTLGNNAIIKDWDREDPLDQSVLNNCF